VKPAHRHRSIGIAAAQASLSSATVVRGLNRAVTSVYHF
jgi:hypothetical protein